MKNKSILILLFFIIFNNSFGNNASKDSSIIKDVIINTVRNYVDSINFKIADFNDKHKVFVLKIEDSIPSDNECFFSLSFIANRSELYDVKPSHYIEINNRVILVVCRRYDYAKKIGIELITNELKEKALKILYDDSAYLKYVLYEHNYFYFFYYKNGDLNIKLEWNYNFGNWLGNNKLIFEELIKQNNK